MKWLLVFKEYSETHFELHSLRSRIDIILMHTNNIVNFNLEKNRSTTGFIVINVETSNIKFYLLY